MVVHYKSVQCIGAVDINDDYSKVAQRRGATRQCLGYSEHALVCLLQFYDWHELFTKHHLVIFFMIGQHNYAVGLPVSHLTHRRAFLINFVDNMTYASKSAFQ